MLEDKRLREFLHTARLTARRTFFNTRRTLAVVPNQIQSARHVAQRVTRNAIRRTPLQVSDDYINGALDLLTATAFLALSARVIHLSTRRYQTAADIPVRLIRRQARLHGSVVAVRDGDNLRIRHTPPLHRLLRLYMRPKGRGFASDTINVRLAAVDAPECGKFGGPGQEYGPAARNWLKRFVGRRVVVKLHATDQYKRVVGTVWAKSDFPIVGAFGFGRRNVGLELTKAGYATLYTGKGAVYGGMKHVYKKAEAVARSQGVGMWRGGKVELPAEFKRALRAGLIPKGQKGPMGKVAKIEGKSKTGPRALLEALGKVYEYLMKFR